MPRKIHGYIDNAELNRARRKLQAAIRNLRRLQEKADRVGAGWIYRYIASIAQDHSEALDALGTMQRIREANDINAMPQRLRSHLATYGIYLEADEARECLAALTEAYKQIDPGADNSRA
jgi:multidrug resistance efflux pump